VKTVSGDLPQVWQGWFVGNFPRAALKLARANATDRNVVKASDKTPPNEKK